MHTSQTWQQIQSHCCGYIDKYADCTKQCSSSVSGDLNMQLLSLISTIQSSNMNSYIAVYVCCGPRIQWSIYYVCSEAKYSIILSIFCYFHTSKVNLAKWYCIAGNFRGVQFSRFSQLIAELRKLDPRKKYICTGM